MPGVRRRLLDVGKKVSGVLAGPRDEVAPTTAAEPPTSTAPAIEEPPAVTSPTSTAADVAADPACASAVDQPFWPMSSPKASRRTAAYASTAKWPYCAP